jgi:hypothetical protein
MEITQGDGEKKSRREVITATAGPTVSFDAEVKAGRRSDGAHLTSEPIEYTVRRSYCRLFPMRVNPQWVG